MQEENEKYHSEVHSEQIRAGRRTYFFDIKATRAGDYFICITESKRKETSAGYVYEKHKIFLYKEDFDKFFFALRDSIKRAREELMNTETQAAGKAPEDTPKD